jgi:hypothetical protein
MVTREPHSWNDGFTWRDHDAPFTTVTPAQARDYDELGYFVFEHAFTEAELTAGGVERPLRATRRPVRGRVLGGESEHGGRGTGHLGGPVRAVAVLMVATPSPLILAAPVAIVSGLSRAPHVVASSSRAAPLSNSSHAESASVSTRPAPSQSAGRPSPSSSPPTR